MTDEEFNEYFKANSLKLWAKNDYLLITKNGVFPNYTKYPPTDNGLRQ